MFTCRNLCGRWLAVIFLSLSAQDPAVAASAASQNETIKASSYADLTDYADSAPLILHIELRKNIKLDAGSARQVRSGWGRFYLEAKPVAALAGDTGPVDSLRYIADLRLDAKGKPPSLKKAHMLIFARAVTGRPGEVQLIAPDAQLRWDAVTETRLRGIIAELAAPDAPPRITGVREALYVPGELSGEGETQMFLATANGSAAAIVVTHRAGMPPTWGVSFSEVLESGVPPKPDTLAWYRLACFLPRALPAGSNLSETVQSKMVAEQDYRLVLSELGPCLRQK